MSVDRPSDGSLKGRATRISYHAYEKFDERAGGRSIREAFALAASAEYWLPNGEPAYPGAQTFVYAPGDLDEELVFVVRDETVVTVVPARDRATVSRNLTECPCCEGVHEFVADCGCVWCNEALEQLQRGER